MDNSIKMLQGDTVQIPAVFLRPEYILEHNLKHKSTTPTFVSRISINCNLICLSFVFTNSLNCFKGERFSIVDKFIWQHYVLTERAIKNFYNLETL